MTSPTQRFSNRVENYVRYRPGYPREVVELLARECGMTADLVVADVGSGTGLLTRLFLERGCRVYGVEPNREMREAGERLLAGYERFVSVNGAAEATTLADHSVDLVAAGQAFHWFDSARARREFARILKPGGWVALVWNERRVDTTPFLRAFERLLQTFGTDYKEVGRRIPAASVASFFAPRAYRSHRFDNRQVFDFDGLKGRLLSTSYTPPPGHPNHQPMLDALRPLYDEHQDGGRVAFEYDTRVYYGQIETPKA